MNVTAVNMPEIISVALLVIAGQFGDGVERQTRLKAAGYDAKKVQACVNELYPIIKKYA